MKLASIIRHGALDSIRAVAAFDLIVVTCLPQEASSLINPDVWFLELVKTVHGFDPVGQPA